MRLRTVIGLSVFCALLLAISSRAAEAPFHVLQPEKLAQYVTRFNATDTSQVINFVPNAESERWLAQNIPLFECPDTEVEEIYYFRWWSFRKHIKKTPRGFVTTEFLVPVSHAGEFNTISCATGFHLVEGRWLRDEKYLNDYTRFWLRGNAGKPQPHFHKFSSWFAAAAYDRYLVTGDLKFISGLLNDLVSDYRLWEQERQLTNGLFWQYDVRDAMEESISGSRIAKNIRPTINSYMFGNANAIAAIADRVDNKKVTEEFFAKAEVLKQLVMTNLWDDKSGFFKVRLENAALSDAREAIGFIPWMFGLPDTNPKYSTAWNQFSDPNGFNAPFGITTAERRHPQFRSHGVGRCEWDGAVWPFATSQTLYALANLLRDYSPQSVTTRDYFDAFLTYVHSQHAQGRPYIGEYLDEVTGDWINGKNDRSPYYNHSTFADLLITGVIGLRPRADDTVEIHPLLPPQTWDWFCVDGIRYHGRTLSIIWDKDGDHYHRGSGLRVFVDGHEIAKSDRLERITGKLP